MSIEPLRASITVRRAPADAFRIFTKEMGSWWPLHVHSLAVDEYDGRVKAETVIVEERVGGRIVERMSDGTEGTWGTVTTWDPPARVVIAWKPNTNTNPPPNSRSVSHPPRTGRWWSWSTADGSASGRSRRRRARATGRAGW
jgi:hypothetical protein